MVTIYAHLRDTSNDCWLNDRFGEYEMVVILIPLRLYTISRCIEHVQKHDFILKLPINPLIQQHFFLKSFVFNEESWE